MYYKFLKDENWCKIYISIVYDIFTVSLHIVIIQYKISAKCPSELSFSNNMFIPLIRWAQFHHGTDYITCTDKNAA